ncbi:hypothetical protein OH809_45425 (plasmid) [Streptomyces sp. NBC_00873]|uniref:hypothetical protein n=1 Tax=unclassified Streptomyces TaxID=2593676 RepID=UPI002F915369|nr:hypothetical protein OH809_45425 [Streptomyces sp. NBC_00873]WTA49377.1 hypothetical protein OH821_45470 [Streptomyces sp. NBC_00842]
MTISVPRPHQHDSTEVLKTALALTSADAKRYAQTGPKEWEDALHQIADGFLDELQFRGKL